MTLEAVKEMDRQCVINWLTKVYRNPTVAFNTHSDEQQIEFAHDALVLLKEQEAKTGKWIEKTDYMGDTYYDCSVCGESWTTIDGTPWQNGMNYCPHCGSKMKLEQS